MIKVIITLDKEGGWEPHMLRARIVADIMKQHTDEENFSSIVVRDTASAMADGVQTTSPSATALVSQQAIKKVLRGSGQDSVFIKCHIGE